MWNNDLVFLGFILAELTDPRGLESNGFPWHQAADLPEMVDVPQASCVAETGTLRRVFGASTSKRLKKKWLWKAKEIRNAMAHHQSLDEKQLCSLKGVRDKLCDLFESAIRTVTGHYNAREIAWCPYPKTFSLSESSQGGDAYRTETIIVACGTEPLLSQRQQFWRALTVGEKPTGGTRVLFRSPAAQIRQKTADKINGRRDRTRKLHILDQDYRRILLQHEEKVWKIRRSVLLEDTGLFFPAGDSAVLVILALSSPLWLLCLFIRTMYGKCKIIAGDN
ncbi:hypothetical protein BDW72DRAFT_208712 [Aspergillus terricola var. indicus]